jgi:CDP-6-deoxy-D-xylo-4-hexulose-3-dehydrase
MAIAGRFGLNVVEDSCETAFADCHGKPVGSWGDIGCFSTYMAHYVVTGVGGVNTTNNPVLAVDLRSLMNHGRDSIYLSIDDDNNLSEEKFREVIAKRFSFVECGHSFRCTEMEAALGVGQLERYPSIVRDRKLVAAKYTAGLRGLEDVIQLPSAPPGLEHVYMLYPIVVRGSEKHDLVECLETHGIETRDLLPLLGQPVYRRMFGDMLRDNPVAAHLDRSGFYIGCHQYIMDCDVEHVIDTLYKFYGRTRQ